MMYSSLTSSYASGAYPIWIGISMAVLMVCLVILKGYALWFAAKREEKWWFIAILVLNTIGILEIVYIVFFVKKYHKGSKGHHHVEGSHQA